MSRVRSKNVFLHMQKQRRRSACSNREANQRLCFCYFDSAIDPSNSFRALAIFCGVHPCFCPTWSETPEDRFCRVAAHMIWVMLFV